MISLIFKILGDATGFKRTVNKDVPDAAKEAGKKAGTQAGATFGKEFGQQMKSGIMSFIGAGAIIAAVRKEILEASELTAEAQKQGIGVEAMQELEKAAQITGLTVKEIQQVAVTSAEAFTKLMEAVQASGGIMDKETVELLVQAGQDLKEVAGKLTPGVAILAKAVNGTLSFMNRVVTFAVGAAHGVVGVMRGDKAWEQTGDEMMAEAWNGPAPTKNKNALSDAGKAFNAGVEASRAREADTKAAWLSQMADLGTAGGQRDLAMMRMVPGMSEEMLDALNEMSSKLTSIDGNIKAKL